MYCRIASGGVMNISGQIAFVETDVSGGLPYFSMVGLLASEVREAGERVRTAIRNTGYHVPPGRITVSLTPGHIHKAGTGYDLAIAVGILVSSGALQLQGKEAQALEQFIFLGELGLDGNVQKLHGILPVLISARRAGYENCIVPKENVREAFMVEDMKVYGVSTLREAIEVVQGLRDRERKDCPVAQKKEILHDIGDISGNEYAKRAVMIAVSGMHNLLLMGQPGNGKSTLAQCIPELLEPPDEEERLEIASIHSICGELDTASFPIRRPFRSPHHTITLQAFAGGGRNPKPGEVTMAHGGVLFLDELAEFRSEVLEALREPLETRQIHISRNQASCNFPADFIFVGAMNNCKCGYYPDRNRCRCSENEVRRYLGRISGPLAERIDMCIQVQKADIRQLHTAQEKEEMNSEQMRRIVHEVGNIQKKRFSQENIRYNSQMTSAMVQQYCVLEDEGKEFMKMAYDSMNLSVRTYYKVIKVARTIADIESQSAIQKKHLVEALGYRNYIGMDLSV